MTYRVLSVTLSLLVLRARVRDAKRRAALCSMRSAVRTVPGTWREHWNCCTISLDIGALTLSSVFLACATDLINRHTRDGDYQRSSGTLALRGQQE